MKYKVTAFVEREGTEMAFTFRIEKPSIGHVEGYIKDSRFLYVNTWSEDKELIKRRAINLDYVTQIMIEEDKDEL